MQIRTGLIKFSKAKDTPLRSDSTTVVFDKPVKEAAACLTGFVAEYSDWDGKEFGSLTVTLSSTINANTVTVTAEYGLRDAGERYDTNFQGSISFAVMAELTS